MPTGDNRRKITDQQVISALWRHEGRITRAAAELGVTRPTLIKRRDRLRREGVELPDPPWNPAEGEARPDSDAKRADLTDGRIEPRPMQVRPLPSKGKVATYLLTAATNNTDIHPVFWRNLKALAAHYEAHGPVEIMVRRIGYQLAEWRRRGASNEIEQDVTNGGVYFDPALIEHICDERVELAPGLHWAGDAPVSATAVNPLSGYDTFTGEASGIFGPTKLEMRSVATMRGQPAKHIITTGAVTQRNYSETKAGQKADWHHVFGATMVEVEADGTWFMRPIVAEDDGTIRDINVTIRHGQVIEGPNVEALTPGDVHVAELSPAIREAIYGPGGVTDTLKPRYLLHQDLHDHKARSHHDARDPIRRYQLHVQGADDVEREIAADAEFLRYAARPGMEQIVVGSNHDDHLHRWLKDADWKSDPVNAEFYLRAVLQVVQAIKADDAEFHLLEWACREKDCPPDVVFLRPDQSLVIGGVEHGLHGDKGPNGARGSVRNIARMASKTTIGHSHSPGIVEGCWQAGVTAGDADEPTMDYAQGPSSWSRTSVVQFEGGKRTMITMRGVRWRAERG